MVRRWPALPALLAVCTMLVLPGSSAAATARRAPVPSVLTCSGRVVARPSSYVLACADANTYFRAIHWTRWEAVSAEGRAVLVENDCLPTCAAGRFVRYPAVLVLSAPKRTKLGLLFSAVRYRYTVTASTTLPLTRLGGTP